MTSSRFTRCPGRRGFTLVEMLVVFVILATVAAIATSVAKSMLTRGRIVQSMANLRSLAAANVAYQAENGVFCPADDQFNNRRWHGARSTSTGKFDPAKGFLAPYLGGSREVGRDPLLAPLLGDASFEEGTGGYGYNAAYIGGLPGGSYQKSTRLRLSERLANISDPGRTVMFTTTAYARASGLQEYPYCEPPFWDFGGGPSGSRPSPTVHFRADGKALVAWCDGSVTAEAPRKSGAASKRDGEEGGTGDESGGTGSNPHGGDAEKWHLGWFGPEENNGYWNPRR